MTFAQHRIATIMLRRNGSSWVVEQLKEFANLNVAPAVRGLALRTPLLL